MPRSPDMRLQLGRCWGAERYLLAHGADLETVAERPEGRTVSDFPVVSKTNKAHAQFHSRGGLYRLAMILLNDRLASRAVRTADGSLHPAGPSFRMAETNPRRWTTSTGVVYGDSTHLRQSDMKVTSIIPTLNEADNIGRAIQRAWSAGSDEVIVVDGGSRDQTVQIAGGASCRLIESTPGRAVQQNRGAEAAGGDVLLFLHADTWLPPGGIDQIRTALGNPQVESGAFYQRIEAPGRVYRWLEQGNAWRARRRGLPYGDQGIFLRRRVFESLGGFPEFRLMEDLLLMKTLRRRRKPVLLPGPLHVSARRWQKHGPVRQTIRNWLLLAAAGAGVSPDRLAGFYALHR